MTRAGLGRTEVWDPPGSAGLSEVEAAKRRVEEGPNELPQRSGRNPFRIAREVLAEPMIALLLGATALYVAFGEPRDALVLGLSVIVVVSLDLYQESRAERALEALRELAAPAVTVLRDGRRRSLPAREVVRGDWIGLFEGERVPADGELRAGVGLLVDESLLTGESVPVRKVVGPGTTEWGRPGGEDRPLVYAQTLVVRGQGWVEVRATGARTEASHIAATLAAVETATPLIRQQTRPLVVGVGTAAVALTALLAIVVGLRSGDWILGLLAGTALAIGLLPEEIPIVTTVYSVLGARRMARHQALARRFGTIPTLGCLTVLCTDKTGTLTLNEMRVSALAVRGRSGPEIHRLGPWEDAASRTLLETAALAGEPEATDPMEVAIADAARTLSPPPVGEMTLLEHLPFTPSFRVVRNRWSQGPGHARPIVVAAKGAPEDLLGVCRLDDPERGRWEETVLALAREGFRTLGVARGPPEGLPESEPADPASLEFLGLLALADPLRPGVPEAVARCAAAGIRVVLITGDHPETARAIGRSAGLPRISEILTGDDLEQLSPETLRERVRSVDLYARVRPEQKLHLVEALRANGEVVGMTGDGVNDAPALRAAHVGIAMGRRGTDVAREAASLVLLDDAFPTVAEAIALGRRVYENMRKALYYIVAVHVAIAGMALLPVLLGFPILLYPVEIVFLELIIDPVSSLVFEGEPQEPEAMRRPPRDPDEPLLGRRALLGGLLLGVSGLVASIAVYLGALLLGHPAAESRALGFATLIVGNLTMVFLCRSSSASFFASLKVPNPIAWAVGAFGVSLLLSALYLPGLSAIFQFGAPPAAELALAAALGATAVLFNDGLKRRWLPSASRSKVGVDAGGGRTAGR